VPRYLPTTALTKRCEHCGVEFKGMPSDLRKRKYCSQDCVGASRRGVKKKEWVPVTCVQCGASFEVTPAWVRNGRRRYCSRACGAKANKEIKRTGKIHTEASRRKMGEAAKGKSLRENSSQWKGGRFANAAGYQHVMVATLPSEWQALAAQMPKRGEYILEHRIVAAAKLGRPLSSGEVVHHLNGDKGDNRPENLIVMPLREHSLEHREIEREMRRLKAEVVRLTAENSGLRLRLGLSPMDGDSTS
jgi:hypothetical protein